MQKNLRNLRGVVRDGEEISPHAFPKRESIQQPLLRAPDAVPATQSGVGGRAVRALERRILDSMSTVKNTKGQVVVVAKQLIAGTEKHLASVTQVPLLGSSFDPPTVRLLVRGPLTELGLGHGEQPIDVLVFGRRRRVAPAKATEARSARPAVSHTLTPRSLLAHLGPSSTARCGA
jgi:hypothetical protein